jgi:hypothetical protein
MACAAALTLGLGLLGGATAHAAPSFLGNNLESLLITPASGPTSQTGTYSTTIGCPAGFQGSAQLRVVGLDGKATAAFSPVNNSGVNAPFSGPLDGTIAQMQQLFGFPNGGQEEVVIECFQGQNATSGSFYVMDNVVAYSLDGTTYSTYTQGQVITVTFAAATTTTVTATPSSAPQGSTVSLSATVAQAGIGTDVPVGTVQFEVNGTAIGTPIVLNASGTAATTTTFTTVGTQSVTAVFNPLSDLFQASTSAAVTETITAMQQGELITVTVPPQGAFAFGASGSQVPLTQSGLTATGTLALVMVTESRTGLGPDPSNPALVNGFSGYPGWSVLGQETDFTAPGSNPAGHIAASQLGWTPVTPSQGDFTLAPGVPPNGPGLGSTPQGLASAGEGHGFGIANFGANLTLDIPPTAPAGAYTGTLTLTANPDANI